MIEDRFIRRLVDEDHLEIRENEQGVGLLENMSDALGLNSKERALLRPEIIHFYEHTADYEFEFWSEWTGVFRPFGWLLAVLFSRRLRQLNLPLSPMDAAYGLESRIIKLVKQGKARYTVWFRTLKANHRVIYSGVYTTCLFQGQPFLKVVFPLPNGNATVLMAREVQPDGSLLLASDGKKFGEHGFYFTLTDKQGRFWAKYVKPMHEWIRVYLDDQDRLRADHDLHFYGLRFLRLHYKMQQKS